MYEVCGAGYINKIGENLVEINERQFEIFYGYMKDADLIIPAAVGRSGGSIFIGLGGLDYNKVEIRNMQDRGCPWNNLLEALKDLERKFENIVLVGNSGRGETPTPRQAIQEGKKHIEKKAENKLTIISTGSNPKSTIGKIAAEYGCFLEVKGREKTPMFAEEFEKQGVMGDVYELLTMLLYQKTKEGINGNRDYRWVLKETAREMEIVGKLIDKHICSDWYSDLIEKMEKRSNIFADGLGLSKEATRMIAMRLQHPKRALGDEVFLPDSSPPVPRPGDIPFFISRSGETEVLLDYVEEYRTINVSDIYTVVGRNSSLSKKSNALIINSSKELFYERVTFTLSPLPILLIIALKKHKRNLPEELLKLAHPFRE